MRYVKWTPGLVASLVDSLILAYSPFPELAEESSDGGDDESDDASASPSDDEMIFS